MVSDFIVFNQVAQTTDGNAHADASANGDQDPDDAEPSLGGQFPLKETFFYKEPKSDLMQDSSDAKKLGLTSLSTVDIMRLKSQLETIMWSACWSGFICIHHNSRLISSTN